MGGPESSRARTSRSTEGAGSAVPSGYSGPQATLPRGLVRTCRRQVSARYPDQFGDPADKIVGAARALDADPVVVGRAQRALRGIELGSVSAEVSSRAPRDVLLVR